MKRPKIKEIPSTLLNLAISSTQLTALCGSYIHSIGEQYLNTHYTFIHSLFVYWHIKKFLIHSLENHLINKNNKK